MDAPSMLAQSLYPRWITWILELLHRRSQQEDTVVINGLHVRICPNVFNPLTGRTTRFFIQHMKIQSRKRILEIGTGSGAIAAAAARVSQSVTATDVNPYAVQCARVTMRLNGLEDQVRVLVGDLFSPVQEEAFDIILFNPPYFKFNAHNWVAKAWSAGSNYEVINRFLIDSQKMLTKSGEVQILLSSAASLRQILSIVKRVGFQSQVIANGRILGLLERVYLFRLV